MTLLGQEIFIDVSARDGVCRFELMLQPNAVEVVDQAQARLLGLVRRGKLGIGRKDLLRAGVQREVSSFDRHALDQSLVVGLPLLPAGGDQRHRPTNASDGERRADVGDGLLRTEQNYVGNDAQLAHTFTV